MRGRIGTLVIGAGPTGLGAAWRLSTRGETDWLVVEADRVAGGLAGSAVDEHGFTWDFGGHVQFSHYEYFDRLMDDLLGPDGWHHHDRESWVWVRGGFVPYPFQLNVHRLPPADAASAIEFYRRIEADRGEAPVLLSNGNRSDLYVDVRQTSLSRSASISSSSSRVRVSNDLFRSGASRLDPT